MATIESGMKVTALAPWFVARSLGMRSIGFEVREEQCEIAANRLRQGVLFGVVS